MYHIKNENLTLCGDKSTKNKKLITISFHSANKSTLKGCCPVCREKYLEKITKLSNITVSDEN
jgi:hypothetical protein